MTEKHVKIINSVFRITGTPIWWISDYKLGEDRRGPRAVTPKTSLHVRTKCSRLLTKARPQDSCLQHVVG